MDITKPIFIIGSGRSGTSLLYNLLATHPDLCWFSNISDRYAPFEPVILFHRLRKLFGIVPSEGGRIYHELCHFENRKKTTERNLSSVDSKRFFHIIESHLKWTGKGRFLNKQTANTQRLRLMNRLFPDAYWIHIIRDGRAVAYSLSQVDWWPTVSLWWHKGDTPSQLAGLYKNSLLLCAEHWKRNIGEIRSCRALFGKRYIEVRYEDLVRGPREIIKDIIGWSGLSRSSSSLRLLPEILLNRNNRWRRELPEKERMALTKHLSSMLRLLHYKP